ncbi:DUF421 domain-containing protein [Pedobacter yonginense]|uniref:DUF421 domain-containing protein n=1 Tax=Pedobacter yonginense TaxID=651869 RepID=A0A317EUE7_9SPHI|nr:YetF domain-containing protein [Pedobacter yonginense]PWS29449.1 DUF421 domain-containing protein [Pedobacter yonginense]
MNKPEWTTIFLNDLDLSLTLEIVIRTVIMFVLVLLFLRSTGKKGVRQLSIFEVAIIIALGSAAGDPMFNQDVAILPALVVFAVILMVYRLITYLTSKSEKVERLLEGEPMYIIEEGKFSLSEAGDSNFAKDEFFAEMRVQNIEHLGQVRIAVLETNGQVSFLYYDVKETKQGLPIFPKPYSLRSEHIAQKGLYACTRCGNVEELESKQQCTRCGKHEWVPAINTIRTV